MLRPSTLEMRDNFVKYQEDGVLPHQTTGLQNMPRKCPQPLPEALLRYQHARINGSRIGVADKRSVAVHGVLRDCGELHGWYGGW